MHPERWQSCTDLFNVAVEQPPDERAAFLERSCDGDEALRRKVELLLKYHDTSGDFIKSPAFKAAPELLAGDPEALIGQRLGCYRVDAVAGLGGMGVVYVAWDERLGRKVALKLLPQSMVAKEADLGRLKREARTASALNHPNIVTIHDIGEVGSTHYVATEFIEGITLRERMTKGPIPPNEALDIAAQVASALCVAHRAGIVHRDIKPENVMLRPDGYVKVLDFGIAKLTQQETLGTTTMLLTQPATQQSMVLGTTRYMSPEQAMAQQVDARSDLWSLGVVLYEMLAGRAPFEGDTATDVIAAIFDRDPQPVKHVAPFVPLALQGVVDRCLRKDPAERYQTAEKMLSELRAIKEKTDGSAARSARWIGIAAVAALLAGLSFFYAWRGGRTDPARAPAVTDKSIAVLPFLDLSETKDQEYFCDGMSEEILEALAKVDGLRVVGRTSSFSFKGKNATVNAIGKKLNVANVVEGTLRREGNRVRVTAELVNASSGFHLWSETYERELQGVFALQDEITRSIVDALKVKLAVSLPIHEQRNTEAYELYLQGLFFSNKSSEADLRRALGFFQRAVEKDPTFSRAWTGIAKVWYFLADVYVRPLDAYPASKEAALKAIALDDKDAEAHCYLSEAKRVLDWDLAGADEELKRALQLDPDCAPAHLFGGLHPLFRGDRKDGLRLILEAQKLDPVSPITSYVATAAYLANDRIDDALIEGQRTLQLDPNYFYLDSILAAAYREKGNFDEAIAVYTKAQAATHLPSSGLAITYTRMGRENDARNILAQLLQAREKRYVSAPLIAAVALALGDKEGAFQELERAYAEHSGVLQWIAFLPEFRALHSDARFPHLLRRISASQNAILKITETTLSETADPNAQSHLTLKVGVKPRPGTQNGHVVRIKVDFYDLTKDNRLKPTNAKVSYNWLSSGRDWTDPTPKFLAATYVRAKSKLPSPDERRFGGFAVSVYFDGQLQDSRASPPELLTVHPAQN
jgi:serine/threonine-protein kinase